jgi:hypothetical protein
MTNVNQPRRSQDRNGVSRFPAFLWRRNNYSVQFTDPFNVDFAYVGTRATGTYAGNYLITGTDWKGQPPSGMKQISSPSNSVLVIGRVLVYSDSDLSTAYNLAKQIRLMPLIAGSPAGSLLGLAN